MPGPLVVAGLMAAGSLLSAKSQQPTKAELVGHYLEAEQMHRNAIATEASGTVVAGERRKEGDRMISDARAAMAAQGGSASDAGAIERAGEIGEMTDYNVLAALFESRTQSAGQHQAAEIKRSTPPRGPGAAATLLSSASKAYTGYKIAGGGA